MTTTTKRAAAFLRWLQVRPAPAGQAGTDPARVDIDPVAQRIVELERVAYHRIFGAITALHPDQPDVARWLERRHLPANYWESVVEQLLAHYVERIAHAARQVAA